MKVDKAFIKITNRYIDFIDVFLAKLVIKLSKYTNINNLIIKLIDDSKPLYSPIYSLDLIELEIMNTYIKNYIANSFIKPSKSSIRAFISFD